jgi:DNA-directed RNA polymerase specialized sigma24 family protein
METIDQFIKLHHPRLIALAVGAGLSMADAEDCAQKVWLYLHRKGTLTPELPVSYLVTTMRGRMLDHWRTQRAHFARGEHVQLDEAPEIAGHGHGPDGACDLKLLRKALRRVGACERDTTQSGGAARVKYFRQRRRWAAQLQPLQHLIAA